MTRYFSDFADEDEMIKNHLNILADKKNSPELYCQTMTQIGEKLGEKISNMIDDKQSNLYLACTVEDADFLAQGILSYLEGNFTSIGFACFWNKRFSPFDIPDLKVAPILRKYQENLLGNIDYLIIIKSIISGACVVKTNLVNLIQNINPNKIFIVAPVMYHTAEEKLRNEFEQEIYRKFEFIYFAQDDERTSEGEVIPGIGGSVYERLGFNGQDDKNRYVPKIVRSRRSRLVNFQGRKPTYICGMSVPPVMMAQIATQVHKQWLSKI